MPIFIDEIIIRGEVSPSPVGSSSDQVAAAETGGADRQLLVSEVTEAVIEHLERVLERIGER
jgi:hypothetical protein